MPIVFLPEDVPVLNSFTWTVDEIGRTPYGSRSPKSIVFSKIAWVLDWVLNEMRLRFQVGW